MENSCEQLKLENQLCFPLYAVSRLITKAYGPYLKELDITYPQYLVMMVLWEHKKLSVTEIGSRLFLESNTLTPLLKRLEQKELITRSRLADDERVVIISITKLGEELKDKAEDIPKKVRNNLSTAEFGDTELIEFRSKLVKLLNILQKQSSK